MEKVIMFIAIFAFFVQSAFVVVLLFRIRSMKKRNAAVEKIDSNKKNDITTEEEKKITDSIVEGIKKR